MVADHGSVLRVEHARAMELVVQEKAAAQALSESAHKKMERIEHELQALNQKEQELKRLVVAAEEQVCISGSSVGGQWAPQYAALSLTAGCTSAPSCCAC